MRGEEGGSAPPNPEKAARPPPHPAASAAHPTAEPQKPVSVGAGLALAKKCPLHLNFPGRLRRSHGSPGPPRLSGAAFQSSFLPPPLPAAKKARGVRVHPPGRARSPLPAGPISRTLGYGNACHLDGGPRVRSPCPRLWVPLRGSCALPVALSPLGSLRPPPRLMNAPRSPRPRSCPFLPRSRLQQNRAARGPKSGKEGASPRRAAGSPTPPPQPRPSQSQLQLFPFGLGFPRAAASGRRAARRGAGERERGCGWRCG